jgi:aminobenzoyl-glutamate transport protein
VLGVIFVVMLAIGVAERSGLFGALIKKRRQPHPASRAAAAADLHRAFISSVATDAGYLVLIPLAGLLYAGLGRNPLIGMAAAFAGVSAGFSANLMPGPVDVIIGMNAQVFAESQGVPFTNAAGEALNPATMHWIFIIVSTFVLSAHRLLGDAPLRRAPPRQAGLRGPGRHQARRVPAPTGRTARPARSDPRNLVAAA